MNVLHIEIEIPDRGDPNPLVAAVLAKFAKMLPNAAPLTGHGVYHVLKDDEHNVIGRVQIVDMSLGSGKR